MPGYVLDASIILAAVLPDEPTPVSTEQMLSWQAAGLHVPALWWLELANGLLAAERRQRLDAASRVLAMGQARAMTLVTDATAPGLLCGPALDLAARRGLSVYDACYLALALRQGATLICADGRLRAAAIAEGVPVLP